MESSGDVPEAAERLQKTLWGGERRPRESKKDFEAILEPKTTIGNFFRRGFWEPWGGLGGALGRLGAAFLAHLAAHRFFIDFLSIFRRFGDGFWYQKSMKKRIENEADFKEFF